MKHLLKPAALVVGATSLLACGGGGGGTPTAQCASINAGDLVITEFMKNPKSTDTGKEWFEIHNRTGAEVDLQGIDLALSKTDGSGEKRHRMITLKLAAGGYLTLGDVEATVAGADAGEGETGLPAWIDYGYGKALGAMANTTGRIALKCGSTVIDEVIYAEGGKEGYSHELNGSLDADADLNDDVDNWCVSSAPTYDVEETHYGTPGSANSLCTGGGEVSGQCKDAVSGLARDVNRPGPGELVLTELMPNPSAVADTSGEWFEVYAPSRDVDLNGLLVGDAESPGSSVGGSETCLTVTAGSYAVLARKTDPALNGGLDVKTSFSKGLTNSGGTIALRVGETVVDAATYGTAPAGKSLQLSENVFDPAANDSATGFCPATASMPNGDFGTPGAVNGACPVPQPEGHCATPGSGVSRPIVAPAAGDLVINEVMANPDAVSDTTGEWFEVYVARDVDLNGVQVGSASTGLIEDTECVAAAAGSYLIFARSDEPTENGGLPAVFRTFSLSLGNTAGSGLSLSLGGNTLDAVTWGTAAAGVSTQVKPANRSVTGNDDPANFCAPSATYGAGDRGTPGAANVCAP